jgi:hypothetical protein
VHHDVDTHDLVKLVHSEPVKLLDGFEIDVACDETPRDNCQSTNELNSNLSEGVFTGGDQSILVSEDSDVEEAKEAANSMDLHSFNRIIDSVSFKDLGSSHVDETSKKANH